MNKEILKIDNLTKSYGDVVAVKNLSMNLNEGEIFGFIGPNGAGKSTTIRCIMNLINKNGGRIYFQGEELLSNSISLKEKIGYLPSEINLYDDLSVKEILDYHERFYKCDLKGRRKELVNKFKLDESKKIEDLSLGNLKKLGIVLAFMHKPKLLILDEPISGLDPLMQEEFYNLLKEEKDKGATILYSTHILTEISKLCDRVAIIKEGTLLKIEDIKDLENKNLMYVTLYTEEIEKIIVDLNLDIIEKGDSFAKFRCMDTSSKFINLLSKYKIEKVLIEEAPLEDLLMHYYK